MLWIRYQPPISLSEDQNLNSLFGPIAIVYVNVGIFPQPAHGSVAHPTEYVVKPSFYPR